MSSSGTSLTASVLAELNATYPTRQLASFGDATAAPKIPFASTQIMSSDAPGATDKVAHSLVSVIRGNYTGLTGSNPSFVWGMNVFTMVDNAVGDGHGANVQNLMETAIASPAGATLATAIGLMSDVAFFGASAGAHVDIITSMRVGAPRRKDGATAGTAGTSYGLFVEQVDASAVGAAGAFSLYVAGGVSRFAGRVDVSGTIANDGAGPMVLNAGYSTADGAVLELNKTGGGGYITAKMPTPSAEFLFHDGTTQTFGITRTGMPRWWAAGNAQTTVGAAGAAAALPAAPSKYFKVQDSAGTTFVIPAYTAA